MDSYRIWVSESSQLFREGLKLLLADSEFEVAVEVPHMEALCRRLEETERPSLILVSADGEDARLGELCARAGDVPVIVLSDELSLAQLVRAMRAGAAGYLLKDISIDVLARSLRLALLGEKILPSDFVGMLLGGEGKAICEEGATEDFAKLSAREQAILRGIARGQPNKVIASELQIAENTVKVTVKTVFRKIRARNRTEAAIWALHNGFRCDT